MGKVCSKLTGRGDVAELINAVVVPEVEKALGLPDASADREVAIPPMKQVELTGRKRSLLIGCNYRGTQNELHGCVNDVERMLPVIERLGFSSDMQNQRVLLDVSGATPCTMPTRANMIEAMQWLIEGAQPGDSLFLHYSGHGGREPAAGTSDGYHESLVPLDFQESGLLIDSDLFDILVKPLPSGCRLTCVLDSCHSAGALDLPFRFVGTEEEVKKGCTSQALNMIMTANWAKKLELWREGHGFDVLKEIGAMGYGLWELYNQAQACEGGDGTGFKTEEQDKVGAAVGEVIAFTGCRSDQTSADVGDVTAQFHLQPVGGGSRGSILVDKQRAAGDAGGALTTVLVEQLEALSQKKLSYLELIGHMQKELASKGYQQVPQVISSLIVDLKQSFALDTVFTPEKSEDNA